jgi:hypothetical protein
MGEARRRSAKLQEFLREHPFCCFCGGLAVADTVDHVPARAIFSDKQWPVSYEFPACNLCNSATRLDEEFIALLSRLHMSNAPASEKMQINALFRSIRRRRPELLREMSVDAKAARNALRSSQTSLPRGLLYRDIPFAAVNGPLVRSAVSIFSKKLGLALYYKHAGRPLPARGALWTQWWTNWSVIDNPIPEGFTSAAPGIATLMRNSADLSNQFSYRWGMSEGCDMACSLAGFRESFAVGIFVGCDLSRMSPIPETQLLRPFDHRS